MARIRTIKPDFWTDEKLTECSLSARLLFIGTWNFADDKGNLQASAKKLKMQIFPADNIDCQPLLDELITHGLLIEYSVNGEKYLNIKNFNRHQVINRPSHSDIPQAPLSDISPTTHGVLTESSKREGKGREGKGKDIGDKSPKPSRGSKIPQDFYPDETGVRLASELDVSITAEIGQFTDHHTARGSVFKDWQAAWRTWARNAQKFSKNKPSAEADFSDVIR